MRERFLGDYRSSLRLGAGPGDVEQQIDGGFLAWIFLQVLADGGQSVGGGGPRLRHTRLDAQKLGEIRDVGFWLCFEERFSQALLQPFREAQLPLLRPLVEDGGLDW